MPAPTYVSTVSLFQSKVWLKHVCLHGECHRVVASKESFLNDSVNLLCDSVYLHSGLQPLTNFILGLHEWIFWQFSSCLGTDIFYYLFCCWQRHKPHLRVPDTRPTKPEWWSKNRTEHSLVSGSFHRLNGPIQTKPYSNIITNTARINIDMFSRILLCLLHHHPANAMLCYLFAFISHASSLGHQPGRCINYMN